MESKEERLKRRNKAIRKSIEETTNRQPKWTIEAVIDEVANRYFLSTRTVNAIISHEGIYR